MSTMRAPRSQGPRRRPHGGHALFQRLHARRNRPRDRTHRPPGALPLGERYEVAQEDAAVRSLTSGAANEPAARGLLPGSNSSALASISMDSSENRTSRPLASPRTPPGGKPPGPRPTIWVDSRKTPPPGPPAPPPPRGGRPGAPPGSSFFGG